MDPLQIYNWEELRDKPQVPTDYGFFIYKKEFTTIIKGRGKKKGILSVEYKRLNRKSYKNIKWMNRMYERRISNGEDEKLLLKVIMPLKFPNGYKLFDQEGEYYGTVVGQGEIFLEVVIRKTDEVNVFIEKTFNRFYVHSQDGKPGLIVPAEFIEGYERRE